MKKLYHIPYDIISLDMTLVRFEEGMTLFFAHSWAINFKEQWQVRGVGSRGRAKIYPFSNPKLRLMHGVYSDLAELTPMDLPPGSIDIGYEIKQFVQAIEYGLPSPVPVDIFLYTNLIFNTIYRSTDLGCEVNLDLSLDLLDLW